MIDLIFQTLSVDTVSSIGNTAESAYAIQVERKYNAEKRVMYNKPEMHLNGWIWAYGGNNVSESSSDWVDKEFIWTFLLINGHPRIGADWNCKWQCSQNAQQQYLVKTKVREGITLFLNSTGTVADERWRTLFDKILMVYVSLNTHKLKWTSAMLGRYVRACRSTVLASALFIFAMCSS